MIAIKEAQWEEEFKSFLLINYQNAPEPEDTWPGAVFDPDQVYETWMVEVNQKKGFQSWSWVMDDGLEYLIPGMVSRDDCDELLGYLVTTKKAPEGLEQVELEQ